MRKIFTLLLCVLFASASFAQREEGVIVKVPDGSDVPVIDGVLDDVYTDAGANVYNFKNYGSEVPTIGDAGASTWQAVYTAEGMYIFVTVADDIWQPYYLMTSGPNEYECDKLEVYFDTNYILEDGLGAKDGAGHRQIAPYPNAEGVPIDGTPVTWDNGETWTYLVDGSAYTYELYVPWETIQDKASVNPDLSAEVGFDITVIDRDADSGGSRQRAVWSNTGDIGTVAGESWASLDGAGYLTFEGAEPKIPMDAITITGGAITADNGTLQMGVSWEPFDATDTTIIWSIVPKEGSNGRATISNKGLITAIVDGTMIVSATSADLYTEADPVEVVITGQEVSAFEISIIKNGDFRLNGKDTTQFWNGVNNADEVIVDGYLSVPATPQTNRWDISVGQSLTGVTDANYTDTYTFKFKAWSSNALDTIPLIIEDVVNGYPKNALLGNVPAEWIVHDGSDVEIPVTDVPQWYEFPVTFPNWIEASSRYAFSFQIGHETGTFNFDSLTFINNNDLDLITTGIAQQSQMETFNVYPNPATNQLHIDLSTVNTRVAIYNSVGVKMEETIVTGTHHMFDVSRYTKGLYFVKANNAVMKFIK